MHFSYHCEALGKSATELGISRRREVALQKNLRKSAAGRSAAAKALKQLGREFNQPVSRGNAGQPLWPEGIVGSISHTSVLAAGDEYLLAVAAVSLDKRYRSIGIDLEAVNRPVSARLGERICTKNEMTWANEKDSLLLFSAKETVYKTLFPLCQQRFWYRDFEFSQPQQQGAVNEQSDTGFSYSIKGKLLRELCGELPAGFELEVFCISTADLILTLAYTK